MGVDTDSIRTRANYTKARDLGVVLRPEYALEIADELDSRCARIAQLEAELAEARKQAIPWRDGLARGGEEPEIDREIVCDRTSGRTANAVNRMVGPTTALEVCGRLDVGGAQRITRFFYVSALPKEPTQ